MEVCAGGGHERVGNDALRVQEEDQDPFQLVVRRTFLSVEPNGHQYGGGRRFSDSHVVCSPQDTKMMHTRSLPKDRSLAETVRCAGKPIPISEEVHARKAAHSEGDLSFTALIPNILGAHQTEDTTRNFVDNDEIRHRSDSMGSPAGANIGRLWWNTPGLSEISSLSTCEASSPDGVSLDDVNDGIMQHTEQRRPSNGGFEQRRSSNASVLSICTEYSDISWQPLSPPISRTPSQQSPTSQSIWGTDFSNTSPAWGTQQSPQSPKTPQQPESPLRRAERLAQPLMEQPLSPPPLLPPPDLPIGPLSLSRAYLQQPQPPLSIPDSPQGYYSSEGWQPQLQSQPPQQQPRQQQTDRVTGSPAAMRGSMQAPASPSSVLTQRISRVANVEALTPQGAVAGACASPQSGQEWMGRTTVMLKNLPVGLSREKLTSTLDLLGFTGCYNFVYVPISFRTKASMCYAFVNMTTPVLAQKCFIALLGFSRWGMPTDNVCEVTWSDKLQGLTQHIERYRNSPLMHPAVADDFKPAVYEGSVRVPFPPPTKMIKPPRMRRGDDREDVDA